MGKGTSKSLKKGNWKKWSDFMLVIFAFCILGLLLSRTLSFEKYAINSKEYIIQTYPKTSETHFVFFPNSEKLTFEGEINGKKKYFLIQDYPLHKSGASVPKIIPKNIYAVINNNDIKYLGNSKYNPIYLILHTSIKKGHLGVIKKPNKKILYNINHHLVYHYKFLGVNLMDLIYYGFWLWVIWGVSYLFYVYILEENFNSDEFN